MKAALECNRQEACQINGLFVHDLTQLRCLWWGGRRGSRLLKLGKMPVANVTVSPVALAKSKTSLKCRCVESSPRNSSASALFCSQLLLRGFLHWRSYSPVPLLDLHPNHVTETQLFFLKGRAPPTALYKGFLWAFSPDVWPVALRFLFLPASSLNPQNFR